MTAQLVRRTRLGKVSSYNFEPPPEATVTKRCFTGSSCQTHPEILQNLGQPWRTKKRHDTLRLKFSYRPIVDGEIGRAVEARWIDDPIKLRRVLVKRHRPSARQVLALCPNNVGRHTHSDRPVASEVDQAKGRRGHDF